MALLRPRCEYLSKENLIEIEDLSNSISRTEVFRTQKMSNYRREQELVVRNILRLKSQKKSYLRQIALLSSEDNVEDTMPVDFLNKFDLPDYQMASTLEINEKDMLKNPTDAILNYVRDVLRAYIPEMDRTLRDFDYKLRKLALREQWLRYEIEKMSVKENSSEAINKD